MKKLAVLLALAFAASLTSAFAAQDKAAEKPAAKSTEKSTAAKPAGKTHEVQAEIVSVDATAKTVTIKAEPENKTVPVDEKAITAVKELKPGQKATLICRDNEKGEHQAIAGVKADASAKTSTKPSTSDKK
jgi:hypothetical protein